MNHHFAVRSLWRRTPIATAAAVVMLGLSGSAAAQASASATAPAAPAAAPAVPVAVAPGAAAAAAAPKPGLETVVVSANKRIEKLENVPMAISVIGEEMIERNNVREMEDIIDMSPALTKTQSDNPANTGLNMRGIGTQSIGIGVEADVAVIVDEIPIGMQVQAFRDLTDVSRVEILKGPQSTLFGKAAIAGAINVVTKPVSGPIVTRATVLASSDREWGLRASVGGNVNEQFGFRIAAANNDFPGNVNNLTTGSKVNGNKGKTFLAKLSWHPTPELDVDFSPRYNYTRSSCCVLVADGISGPGGYLNNVTAFPASLVFKDIQVGPGNRDIRNDTFTGQESTSRGYGLKVSYALPNGATLTSISSGERYHANDSRDQDFTDLPVMLYYKVTGRTPLAGINAGSEQHGRFDVVSRTQELRLTSEDSGNWRYVAGLWYAKNELNRYFKRGEFGLATTSPTEFYGDTYNINRAVFGQASWAFVPATTVTGGLRFNKEESGYHFAGAGNPSVIAFGAPFTALNRFSSVGNKENATTGKLSLQHQFLPTLMAYAMTSTGYKGRAYDITSSLSAFTAAQQPVKSETARTVEVGMKGNFFDNRLTVNGTLFSSKFRNYQQNSGSYLPETTIYVTRLNSLDSVSTRGAELDVNALAGRDLLLNASMAYTDARIDLFKNATCYTVVGSPNSGLNASCILKNPLFGNQNTNDVSGGTMPFAPRRKANLGFKYDWRLDDMRFDAFFNGNATYQSTMYSSLDQNPDWIVRPKNTLNLGFGLREKSGRATLSFRVNNVLDKRDKMNRPFNVGSLNASAPNPVATVGTTTWTPLRSSFRYLAVRLDVKY